ncbi:MAG: 2-hydroxychromene-2-carboxylate isomerase [Aestuariivirgaceae bacterium]
MSQSVDFYYDYGSPTAYLAWTQLPGICAECDATLNYRPVLLGGVFKATENNTPVAIKPKGAWMFDDISRFAERYGVPFTMNPHFIINTIGIMRGAVWALNAGCLEAYNKAMYEATWLHGRNTGDADEVMAIMTEAGLDGAAMAEAVQTPEVKKALIDLTSEAVGRGAFGAPTMFVNGEVHFGQDRLDWVKEALLKAA